LRIKRLLRNPRVTNISKKMLSEKLAHLPPRIQVLYAALLQEWANLENQSFNPQEQASGRRLRLAYITEVFRKGIHA
jgi:hypothetical protein